PQAAAMCLARGWLWNTFVMVAKASALVSAADVLLPGLHRRLTAATPFLGTRRERGAPGEGHASPPPLPPPNLLRDGLAGRAALSRGVGAAAAHLVRSRNAGAAVQALPGSGDHSALDPRAPGADRERVEREGAMNP